MASEDGGEPGGVFAWNGILGGRGFVWFCWRFVDCGRIPVGGVKEEG